MYKAVFVDLDGTLLDDKKNISDENKEAIKYVLDKGGNVYITSGRPLDAATKFRDIAQTSRYVIFSNGAGIYDTQEKEVISLITIDAETCLEVYNYAINEEICIRLDTPYGRYITDMKYCINTDVELNEPIEKFLEKNKIVQLSCLHENENKIKELVKFINTQQKKDLKVEDVFKTGYNCEFFATCIINCSASKGNAVAGLCKFLKIDIKDAITMGDGLNDISMLSTAGLGVAMGNGSEEVKALAKKVTITNNENGVAKVLKENF